VVHSVKSSRASVALSPASSANRTSDSRLAIAVSVDLKAWYADCQSGGSLLTDK